jgi:SAM-dependent methyltransferase
MPLADGSMDFGYSLGVLHHLPDPLAGLADCVRKLKPGAPMLIYIYYAFDNRPAWFRLLWRASDYLRRAVAKAPFQLKSMIAELFVATIYLQLARSEALRAISVSMSQTGRSAPMFGALLRHAHRRARSVRHPARAPHDEGARSRR